MIVAAITDHLVRNAIAVGGALALAIAGAVGKNLAGKAFSKTSDRLTDRVADAAAGGIWARLVRLVSTPSEPPSLDPREDSLQRDRLLDRLSTTYTDRLRQALGAIGSDLEPELRETPHAVAAALKDALPRAPLDHANWVGSSIRKAFDLAGGPQNGRLLILGEPGSGKTTKLLELAAGLVEELKQTRGASQNGGGAPQNGDEFIPVFISLASWGGARRFETWLPEQLQSTYSLNRGTAERWLGDRRFLLLLDGLDEIPARDVRGLCASSLNTFMKTHDIPVVVCSRSLEYTELPDHLTLNRAVAIQPLTVSHVKRHLRTRPEFAGLRAALRDDPQLEALLTSPLFVSVLAEAYRNHKSGDIRSSGSVAERRERLLKDYVRGQLAGSSGRRKDQRAASEADVEQNLKWLQFLSTQLSKIGESQFTLTIMKPEWLSARMGIAVFALALLPLIILNIWLFGYLYGLILSAATGAALSSEVVQVHAPYSWSLRTALRFRVFPMGAVLGVSLGFIIGLMQRGVVDHVTIDHPRVTLPWWSGAPLVGGVLGAAIFWLIGGIVASRVRRNPSPYEGIKRALLNGVGVFAGIGAIGLLMFIVLIKLTSVGQYIVPKHTVPGLDGTSRATQAASSLVLAAATLGAWLAGLGAVLRHWLVRFGLWVADDAPLRYVTWLNDLVDSRIVYRAGGGFVLIHRVLQEHLSAVAAEPVGESDRPSAAQAGESPAGNETTARS